MEGRAFLYNPVLGADQPKSPATPCSPSEDSNKCNKPTYHSSESMQELSPIQEDAQRKRDYGHLIQCALGS